MKREELQSLAVERLKATDRRAVDCYSVAPSTYCVAFDLSECRGTLHDLQDALTMRGLWSSEVVSGLLVRTDKAPHSEHMADPARLYPDAAVTG